MSLLGKTVNDLFSPSDGVSSPGDDEAALIDVLTLCLVPGIGPRNRTAFFVA